MALDAQLAPGFVRERRILVARMRSDSTTGAFTVLNLALEAINRIEPTASSITRASLAEAMGPRPAASRATSWIRGTAVRRRASHMYPGLEGLLGSQCRLPTDGWRAASRNTHAIAGRFDPARRKTRHHWNLDDCNSMESMTLSAFDNYGRKESSPATTRHLAPGERLLRPSCHCGIATCRPA